MLCQFVLYNVVHSPFYTDPYLNGHLSLPFGGQAAAAAAAAAAASAAAAAVAAGATSPGAQSGMPNLRLSPALSNRSSEESVETSSTSATTTGRPKNRRSTKEANPEAITPHDYKCPLCSEILPCQRDFTAHIRGHNEVKPQNDPNDPTGQAKVYYCCLCGKMLSSFSSLDRHMLVHSGERPFSCHLCGQTFTTNGNMHRHSRTHGNRDSHESDISSAGSNSGSKRAILGGGSRKRKSSVDSVQHQPISNVNGSSSANNILPSSGSIATSCASPSPLAMSELLKPDPHHYPFSKISTPINNALGGGHVKCPICPDMFYSEISMETHVGMLHAGQAMDCDECKQKFPSYGYLRLHKNIYHHRSDASFPLQSLSRMQALTSPISSQIPILPPSSPSLPISILPPVQIIGSKIVSPMPSPILLNNDEKIGRIQIPAHSQNSSKLNKWIFIRSNTKCIQLS